ncbi:uncharacterized protein LOC143626583 [Bidens hawaiensis]|uniref:uncharacterized protein LOC143626583 n=1 Tax=Bidens hawaiensis TaxID=980011 RepID=UPI00404B1C30
MTMDSVIRSCKMNLNGHIFSIDLIPMQLGCFDIIVGMDWLSSHCAKIVCFEKIIRIPIADGQSLRVVGEKPSPSSLNLITCFQAQTYLRKKYVVFVAHVVEKMEQKIEDIPVVCEYPEVFSDDISEMNNFKMPPSEEDQINTLKYAPPASYSTYLLVLKENGFFKKENLSTLEFV